MRSSENSVVNKHKSKRTEQMTIIETCTMYKCGKFWFRFFLCFSHLPLFHFTPKKKLNYHRGSEKGIKFISLVVQCTLHINYIMLIRYNERIYYTPIIMVNTESIIEFFSLFFLPSIHSLRVE